MRIYTLIISALAVVTAQAGPVDINKAKALAQKYVSSPISVETASLAAMGKGKQAQVAEPALHMFNNQNGLIHVNWGWAGLDDGYFDINTAAVAGGGYGSDGCYYEKQLALFVHPNNGVIEPLSPKPVVLSINNDQGLQFQASEG